jgi:hypothetical protein
VNLHATVRRAHVVSSVFMLHLHVVSSVFSVLDVRSSNPSRASLSSVSPNPSRASLSSAPTEKKLNKMIMPLVMYKWNLIVNPTAGFNI